jgi:hypothetical protein
MRPSNSSADYRGRQVVGVADCLQPLLICATEAGQRTWDLAGPGLHGPSCPDPQRRVIAESSFGSASDVVGELGVTRWRGRQTPRRSQSSRCPIVRWCDQRSLPGQ